MRNNQPVTAQEYHLADQDFLISRTTRGGRITYANPAFIKVSGFTREELIGSPHNIVRHPDMPREAFADLWATLKGGRTWTGLVKNRRKDGGFYWVKAHVAPIVENGEMQGYVSMRTKAPREAIEAAERAYTLVRSGRGKDLMLEAGALQRRGVLPRLLNSLKLSSLQLRLAGMALLGSGLLLAQAGLSGAGDTGAMDLTRWGLPALGTLLLFAWAWQSGRAISKPLSAVHDFALQIAAGNLAAAMPQSKRGDLGRIAEVLDLMRKSLASIAGDVNEGVRRVAPATHEINQASQDLSARTVRQAASLQQTVGSMDQILNAVQQSAGHAGEASSLSADTAGRAGASGAAMRAVVETMGRITESSGRMSAIIDVIDSIAFQTNILALNASVEAARAGEQGRGFAVVAGEVRSLARRSADAAKEVRELIDSSAGEVDLGARQVRDAEAALTAVLDAVARIKSLITDIADATREQNAGIAEINAAVTEMDQVTRENAGQVQSTATACHVLDEQMRQLTHSVAVFRLQNAGKEDVTA